MGNSASIEVDFDGLIEYLNQQQSELKQAAEKMLKDTHKAVTPKAVAAMPKRTGRTVGSVQASPVIKWAGTEASVEVGFKLKKGWRSILFTWGTPRMSPAAGLEDALFGTDDLVQEMALAALEEVLG